MKKSMLGIRLKWLEFVIVFSMGGMVFGNVFMNIVYGVSCFIGV